MPEPASTTAAAGVSLITLATALLGPLLGPALGPLLSPYIVIIICSAVGAQWALLASPSMSRMQSAALMLRVVATAVVLTAMLAQILGAYFGMHVTESYGAVAFVIGMLGHRWTDMIDAVRQRLLVLIGRVGGNA